MEKAAAMPPPPRLYLPRNFSCTACLYGSLGEPCKGVEEREEERAFMVSPPWEQEEPVEKKEEQHQEPAETVPATEKPSRGREPTLAPQSPSARRRAKSLPTPGERHPQLEIAASAQSPSRRKTVRFADSLGLELTTVRHFSDAELPQVPARVLSGLRKTPRPPLAELSVLLRAPVQSMLLEPLFPPNPGVEPGFLERVRQQHLALESLRSDQFSVSGMVRVLNLSYEKTVSVRYSLDHWTSATEVPATYLPGSSDRHTDRFTFKLVAPSLLDKGGLLEFAIRYCVCGAEYWDNNEGINYRVRSHRLRVSPPPRECDNTAWIHFI